jgi:holliday junction DNA helicase RuvA
MYDFISGRVAQVSPTSVVIDNQGIGYIIHISLNTFEQIKNTQDVKLFVHLAVREDSHTLFGFSSIQERELFLKLLSVNGIGAATARMILSALSVEDATNAILSNNVGLLKSVKGIGPKAAQRIIVELQDKLNPIDMTITSGKVSRDSLSEASEALVALGYTRPNIQKVLLQLCKNSQESYSTEILIKKSLQLL